MNFSNHTLAYEDLRDCTLITKNGTKIPVTIDYIETTANTFPKFEGHITGTAKVFYCNILNSTYGIGSSHIPEIKNVIFNDPATIVFWGDGTKTVVKCQPGDRFDPEKGLAMAIVKKAYGNKGSYCNQLKKWLPKEGSIDISQKPKNRMTFREEEAKKHPENISALCKGGVLGCPRDKEGNCTVSVTDKNCRACWDRVIPDELLDND